ncbi:hypothetical protein UlMin_000648 [Ulmus minor]
MALLQEPSLLFSLTTLFLVIIFLKFIFKKPRKTSLNLPPSPPKLPIIGNLHQLGTNPHISLRNLAQKYGKILYLKLGEIPTVIVSSPRLAEKLFKSHDIALSNRPQIISAKYLFYNCTDIGFSPYGAYWRYIRKICIIELLSTKRVQSFSFVREEEVARLVSRVSESCPGTVSLSKLLGSYANNVVCRVAFGMDFTVGGDYDKQGFQKLLQEYQELLGGLSIEDFFPSKDFIHILTGMKSRLVNTFTRFDKLFDEIIAEHQNPKRERDEKKVDLVDVLLDIQKNDSGEMPLTVNNVKAIILDMFAAGTDTIFITLDWVMTELVMNPKAMEEAQAEVRSVVGKKRIVLESDIPHMNYLKAVIKETYRLHPPAPLLLPRESSEELTVDGYNIPAKTRIFVNAWAIGRDPEIWEDPETFKPERFIGSNIDFKGTNFELIPFGAGRRICPGMDFGTASFELALAQLLHSFDWELPPGKDLDMAEVFGITMHRKEGLVVLVKPHFL